MVFINKVKDIIKLFEESNRDEIGIALLAYEEFISKGLKVSDEDLTNLTDVFNYYDEEFSDDYPSLTNEVLQNCDELICNYFSDYEKDGYKFNIQVGSISDETTSYEVEVSDKKTGIIENEYRKSINNNGNDYGYDSFNTIFKTCKEVRNQIENKEIKDLLNNFIL